MPWQRWSGHWTGGCFWCSASHPPHCYPCWLTVLCMPWKPMNDVAYILFGYSHHIQLNPFWMTACSYLHEETLMRQGLLVPRLNCKGETECSRDPGTAKAVGIKEWYFQEKMQLWRCLGFGDRDGNEDSLRQSLLSLAEISFQKVSQFTLCLIRYTVLLQDTFQS